MVGNCPREGDGKPKRWKLHESIVGEFFVKMAIFGGVLYLATLWSSRSAHASQEDDLHRIAVAVEKIAQHVERCK